MNLAKAKAIEENGHQDAEHLSPNYSNVQNYEIIFKSSTFPQKLFK